MTKEFETFSTTADVGIRIRGKSYRQLYTHAVEGLNWLYFGKLPEAAEDTPVETHVFTFEGDSGENVLVNLLSEVVFLLQSRGKITLDLSFREATGVFVDVDFLTVPLFMEPELEIKSVTYHNLSIHQQQEEKYAEIVFDI